MNRIFFFTLLFSASFCLNAQNFEEIQKLQELAIQCNGYFEGYSEKVLPNTFNYHSFRHDIGASMITRCLETPNPMSWKTEPLPNEILTEGVGFVWIAAMDLNTSGAQFSFSFNGKKRFSIAAANQQNWSLKSVDGGLLSFNTIMTDRHGDAHGYMKLWVPKSWILPGEEQLIHIQGDQSNQSTWIIVYEASDALSFLQESSSFDALFSLDYQESGKDAEVLIRSTESAAGKEISIETGKYSQKLILKGKTGFSETNCSIPIKKLGSELKIFDEKGEILVWDLKNTSPQNSIMMAEGVLKNQLISSSPGRLKVISQRNYMPDLVESMLALSSSSMASGQILLMNSSHQDIAWMDSPEKCIVERDTMLLQPLFNRAAVDPDYRFDVEDALMIKEYIQRHPDKKELVGQLLNDGRISCGATYIQPYEEMYSGEALARQFYFGAKWLKDEFGYVADTYWNVDVPGRTLQMPQLMKKAGVKNLVMTRQALGFYNWYSPDGSSITGFSNGHYGNSFGPLNNEYYIASDYLAAYSFLWESFYKPETKGQIIPLLSDWDMSPAKDYSQLISSWKGLKELKNKNGEIVPVSLPAFREALAPEMFEAFRATDPLVPSLYGERPALWLYIHGPSHQKALKASREADILLTQLEKIASINALLEGSFNSYPEKRLQNAWEAKIYPDHGWGGKMGLITDDLFRRKYEFARSEAREMMNMELAELGSRITVTSDKGRPVLVFNSLSWMRSSPLSLEISFDPGLAGAVELYDASGNQVSSQLSEEVLYLDGSIRSATLNFIGKDIPAVGYKTLYLKSKHQRIPEPMPKQGKRLENSFYIIEFGSGGVNRIFDKELDKDIINPEGFTAGEVFTLRSIGNGAGEFSQVQQPDTVGFDKTGNYSTAWKLVEDGPVFVAYAYRQAVRNAVVEQKVILYKEIKKIDFEVALLNWEGVLYREYRMALPVNAEDGKVVYQVPYGKLEVGKDEMEGMAGERYTVPAKDIHPRAMENWINVSSNEIGVTLSSSVVGVDYVDITGTSGKSTLIQPILLTSRKSCHGEGNDYLQTGNHYFSFSLNSHQPGWENGYRFGLEANEKLQVMMDFKMYADADLPEEKSFFSIDQNNVILSVIKKAEDNNDIIIRAYEVEGIQSKSIINSAFRFKGIEKTNLIEQALPNSHILKPTSKITFNPFSIETYKWVLL